MTYKPQVLASGGFIRGVGKVAISSGKTKVRVTILNDDKPNDEYTLLASDCPEYVKPGTFSVTLSSDGKKMMSCYPMNGVFTGRVQKFTGGGQNNSPAPKTNSSYNYQYFVTLNEITDGKYKGMVCPFILRYHFEPTTEKVDGKPRKVVAIGHEKSKYTEVLMDYCLATGVWDAGPMPFKANVLPMLEKRILRAKKTFSWVMKNGFVSSIMFDDDMPEIEDDEGEGNEPSPSQVDESDFDENTNFDNNDEELEEIDWTE